MPYECRHFIDDDGTTYLEEQDIITKRWPKRMVPEDEVGGFTEQQREDAREFVRSYVSLQKGLARARKLERRRSIVFRIPEEGK